MKSESLKKLQEVKSFLEGEGDGIEVKSALVSLTKAISAFSAIPEKIILNNIIVTEPEVLGAEGDPVTEEDVTE